MELPEMERKNPLPRAEFLEQVQHDTERTRRLLEQALQRG